MINTMTLDGFTAIITYDPDKDWFRGVIQGLNGTADFHGRTPEELRKEFKNSLAFFIEICERKGRPVRKAVERQVRRAPAAGTASAGYPRRPGRGPKLERPGDPGDAP